MKTPLRTIAGPALALILLSNVGVARAQTASDSPDAIARDESDPSIRREIESARARGIPVEPLLSKVREGRLKRAPAPRIRLAVAALADRLDSARAIIGADATIGELTACADALAAGAGTAELRMVTSASSRPVSAPLGALAQLVASGVPAKRAAEMIVELLRRKVGGSIVLAFGNLVESDAASGVPAEEAAAFRLHSLASGGSAAPTAGASPGVGSVSTPLQPPPSNTKPRRRP